MAHYYGELVGSRGITTRLGHKGSGLRTTAASWEGAVRVYIHHDSETGHDYASVALVPWEGAGITRLLFEGRIDGDRD